MALQSNAVLASCKQTRRRLIDYRRGMGAKQVDNRDNGHTARTYGNPLGVECEACGRRALVLFDPRI